MNTSAGVHLTKNVFVAGGTPQITYNPRDARRQEIEVASFLDQHGKALSVSGPTKSGKTVLIERSLPRHSAIWIQGSDIGSAESFWEHIVDFLGLYDQVEVSTQNSSQVSGGISGKIGVPLASVGGKAEGSETASSTVTVARRRSMASVAREGLQTLSVPIVIDDFHYISQEAQLDVARAVKSIIPTTHVVLIAVPHEAFEVVRREPDMNGRVWDLAIQHWSVDELCYIGRSGFSALNAVDNEEQIGHRLAAHSYGAPFLMQQLCYEIAIENGIQITQKRPAHLGEPRDGWDGFFQRIARRTVPGVFEKLLQGPKTRGQERIDRTFNDGVTTDIYGAVLRAIATTGPKTTLGYKEISRILDTQLATDKPSAQQLAGTLNHMAIIANDARGSGDPAIAYKDGSLHILDPFLAFYLRWGAKFDISQ
jgi:hypothetical protein